MTTMEWKALKNHGLNLHPWKVTMVGKIMNKLRRELGEDIWMALIDILKEARVSKNMELWHTALKPYYEKASITEELASAEKKIQELQDLKLKRIQEIDNQRQALIRNRPKENVTRIKPNTTIIRRKKEVDSEGNIERVFN